MVQKERDDETQVEAGVECVTEMAESLEHKVPRRGVVSGNVWMMRKGHQERGGVILGNRIVKGRGIVKWNGNVIGVLSVWRFDRPSQHPPMSPPPEH